MNGFCFLLQSPGAMVGLTTSGPSTSSTNSSAQVVATPLLGRSSSWPAVRAVVRVDARGHSRLHRQQQSPQSLQSPHNQHHHLLHQVIAVPPTIPEHRTLPTIVLPSGCDGSCRHAAALAAAAAAAAAAALNTTADPKGQFHFTLFYTSISLSI